MTVFQAMVAPEATLTVPDPLSLKLSAAEPPFVG
jgi:hypothetical protein